MNTKQFVAILTLAFVAGAHAATPPAQEEQSTHHQAEVSAPQFDAAKIDQHMKVMQEIHEKMIAARTPEERAVVMQEGMKSMQDGMAMMGQMRRGMGIGKSMGNNMGGMGASKGTPMDCTTEHRRMDMMEAMMQLMIDQQAPTK
ncbi:MAG: hypothetical protein ACOH2T_26980 [Pseudomonas sp.]